MVKKTKSNDSEAMYGYDEQMEKHDKDNETTTGKGSVQDDTKDDVVIEDEDEKDVTLGNSLVDENNNSTLDSKGFIGDGDDFDNDELELGSNADSTIN